MSTMQGIRHGNRDLRRIVFSRAVGLAFVGALGWALGWAPAGFAQDAGVPRARIVANAQRSGRFLAQRKVRGGGSSAVALSEARRQHLALLAARGAKPHAANLSAQWQPVGPSAVLNPVYGDVSGRVTAVAIDPSDATGNTVYLGTTGGGVWKSTNAASAPGQVSFVPLTDTLPVFDLSAGSSATPSLSIGALAIGGGVLLAGTGDPNDATDSYYGGGILRSADGGLTWTLATESTDGLDVNRSFVGLSVSALAFSSVNPLVAVAALGQSAEGNLVNAESIAYQLQGLYVSNDAGVTWQVATVMDGNQIVQNAANGGGGGGGASSVVWNPIRQMFFAALSGHGYYQSPDGANWIRVASQPGAGINLTNCPTLGTGGPSCPVFRGALSVQPTTGDMYALSVNQAANDEGLYEDVCAPANGTCANANVLFGTPLNSAPLDVGGGSTGIDQGTYNLALAAVPSGGDTLLYVGTVDLYRCDVGTGCTLRDTTNAQNGCANPAGVAPAQHAIAALGTLLYLGNDGGLWRSTDGVAETGGVCSASDASHFQNLNGAFGPNGSLAEVVSFAQDPVGTGTLLAGLGALGSAGTGTGTGAWAQMSAGEGGTVAIDPATPANWYVSIGAGVNIARCEKGAACGITDFAATAIGAAQVANDVAEIHAPWLLDPGATGQLLAGTCRVWRGPATGGSGWSTSDLLSAPFSAPNAIACGSANSPLAAVRSLGAGGLVSSATGSPAAGSEVLYAGMAGTLDGGKGAGGHLFTTDAAESGGATTAWTDAALSPVTNDASDNRVFNPVGFDLSSIAVDSHDATGLTAYATVMGFAGNGLNSPHVYRTLSGGADWTNISSNLPNAPANSVVVDPNDANTVYVAMDTGVYVTTSVATCATQNCWDVYGTGLPNAPVTQLAAAQAMATGDGRTGELRAATYGRGIWSIPLVNAILPVVPAMTLNPTSLSFGSQQAGTDSAPQTITVTNTGIATLNVTGVVATGDFVETDTCVGMPVAVGGTCTVAVIFAPTVPGSRTGVLTLYGNVVGGQATAALNGVGTAPALIELTPPSLSFPLTAVGAVSAPENVTISNIGGNPTTIQSIAVSGAFFTLSANGCGTTLGASTGCTVSVECAPTATGAGTGTLTVVDPLGTQVANLSCTGQTPATDTLAPLSLSFGTQQLGAASVPQTVTLTNAGDASLTLIQDQITAGFSAVNGCGASLSGHSSCSFSVSCIPGNVGAQSGTLTVNDVLHAQTVALTCTGVAPPGVSLAPPGGLAFAATAVGQTSPPQTVTLTNNGGLVLAIGQVQATGDFAVATDTCGTSLATGANCTIGVTFTPTAGGARTGSVTLTDNAPASPQSVPLSGVGVDFALNPDSSTTQTISSGQTATYLLLLTSVAGVPGNAVFTCSGIPQYSVCTVTPSPTPVYAQNGTVITVTIATGQTTGALDLHPVGWAGDAIWLAALLPIGFALRRRRRKVPAFLLAALLLSASGCTTISRTIPPGSGGGGSGGGGSPVTPSGTSTITVAGSSAGLVRAVNLTLIVP